MTLGMSVFYIGVPGFEFWLWLLISGSKHTLRGGGGDGSNHWFMWETFIEFPAPGLRLSPALAISLLWSEPADGNALSVSISLTLKKKKSGARGRLALDY